MTIAESIQLNKEQIARAFGVPAHMLADPDRTAVARYCSLCMTSENHGTVGPAGCKFSHAPDKHERVLVVEVLTAAGAPVDQVNLQLVTSEGHQADIDRALRAAQAWANEEYMCGRRMGKGEPAMSDRADAAKIECATAILALAAPVGSQASQLAVPGWISVDERLPEGCNCLATYRDRAGKLRIIRAMYVCQFEIEATCDECDSETDEANDREYLKAGWYELIDNWDEYSSVHVCEGPVTHWMALPALPDAQASTSGERQEGGQS